MLMHFRRIDGVIVVHVVAGRIDAFIVVRVVARVVIADFELAGGAGGRVCVLQLHVDASAAVMMNGFAAGMNGRREHGAVLKRFKDGEASG
jgi:hypothetical protein